MEIEGGFQFWNKKQMLRRKYKILGVEREVICGEKPRKSNHKSFVFFKRHPRRVHPSLATIRQQVKTNL
jgi:hypothetical protein